MTVKNSIVLTDEQHAFAKALVDTGRSSSISAGIQQGTEDLERKALYEILSRRRSGEFVGVEEMDERLRRMLADKRRASISDPNP